MLRVCARRLASNSRLLQGSLVGATQAGQAKVVTQATVRFASTSISTKTVEVPVLSNPETLPKDRWEPCFNFMSEWYEGLDTLHIIQDAEIEKTGAFRGVSFFNSAHEWQGCVRWCESLRGGEPSVWVHWIGRDPVEIATSIPAPDSQGRLAWSMTFTKRQFVLYCNNELVGTRDNMLYQHKSVNKFWLPDFEHLKGSWAIEGPHTVFTENKQYQDVGIFRKFDKQWNAFMEKKRIIDADHARQGSWRGGPGVPPVNDPQSGPGM